MKASPQFTSWRAVALLPLAAALTCAALAACGSHATGKGTRITATPAATVSRGSGLCANTQSVQRLSVRRINSLPQNHEHFTFPAHVDIDDPGKARAVAQAACKLPPMPPGGFSCPADWGITYTLNFMLDETKAPAVTIDATDCQDIKGLGRTRWVARTPAFWSVLGQAMDIPHASNAVFRGSMRYLGARCAKGPPEPPLTIPIVGSGDCEAQACADPQHRWPEEPARTLRGVPAPSHLTGS